MKATNADQPKPYQAVRTKRLYEEIMQQIEARIASGELQVGERLPSQRELAESLGVSSVAVKEALRALAAKGLVEVRRGSGAYVSDRALIAMSEVMRLFVDERSLQELQDARVLIESEVVRRAATYATDEDLIALREAFHVMEEELAANGTYCAESSSRFHLVLAEASHNVIFRIVMGLLLHVVLHIGLYRYPAFGPEGPEYALELHRQILEAIEARDPEQAQEAMREHSQAVQSILTVALADGAGGDESSSEVSIRALHY
jgi:DNA-binding FadR family transcriptional regulator